MEEKNDFIQIEDINQTCTSFWVNHLGMTKPSRSILTPELSTVLPNFSKIDANTHCHEWSIHSCSNNIFERRYVYIYIHVFWIQWGHCWHYSLLFCHLIFVALGWCGLSPGIAPRPPWQVASHWWYGGIYSWIWSYPRHPLPASAIDMTTKDDCCAIHPDLCNPDLQETNSS